MATMFASMVTYVVLFIAFEKLVDDGSESTASLFIGGASAIGFLALGYMEFWSLIERSFSLRILIDAAAAGERGITIDELANAYGGGRGLEWMMSKRLEGLLGLNLLEACDESYRLSAGGRRAAAVCQLLIDVLGFRD